MKWLLTFSALLLSQVANADQLPAALCAPNKALTFTVVNSIQRSSTAFTEGLFYENGELIESSGSYKQTSYVNSINIESGLVTHLIATPGPSFGEGITRVGNNYFQLSYKEKKVFIYDSNFKLISAAANNFSNEGWGLTTVGRDLVTSDGTNQLRFLDANNFSVKKILNVVDDGGQKWNFLNELEAVGNSIFANVYYTDYIARIDNQTGCVTGYLTMTPLRSLFTPDELAAVNADKENVLNGIAYNPQADTYFVTGKNWPRIFEIKISQQ